MTTKKTTTTRKPATAKKAASKKAASPKTTPKPRAAKNAKPETPTAEPKAETKPKSPKTDKAKGMSAIDAAAKVLSEAGEPLNTKQMIEVMAEKGYWTSPGGKTPHATLYSAILRDLAKGDEARFVKTERGRFTVRG